VLNIARFFHSHVKKVRKHGGGLKKLYKTRRKKVEPKKKEERSSGLKCSVYIAIMLGAAVAQWGKGVVLQPQGCRFDPGSPH